MPKYRKKPVVIEAVQWSGPGGNTSDVLLFLGAADVSLIVGRRIVIRTLEGDMTAEPGDYIIRGVKGEFYPCKPDIFSTTYDEVDG